MATDTASSVSALSYFTEGMSCSEYGDSSDFVPEPHRHPRREIARYKRMAPKGRARNSSTVGISGALLNGSTPIQGDLNPSLGPIGSGRPKSSMAGKDCRGRARRHKVYPCGDMSNLRPDDRGMGTATCLEFYRMSTASGEQEPLITTTTADSSDSDASTTKKVTFDLGALLATPSTDEQKTKVRTRAHELDKHEALPAMTMRRRVAEELRGDGEVTRRTNDCTLVNILDGIDAPEP